MKTLLLIVLIVILFLMVSIPIWLAIRVMRHPEKDRGMRRVMEVQRGAEYETGMQRFFMVNYVSTGLAWVLAALLEIVFHIQSFLAMWIACLSLCLVLLIAKWRFTGEFSKAGFVTSVIGLSLLSVYMMLN